MLSIIIPVLNEADKLEELLKPLSMNSNKDYELIGVDGGSTDRSYEVLQKYCDIAIKSPKGRSIQMNAGAKQASKDNLLFLHADTLLPADFSRSVASNLEAYDWGRFNVRLNNAAPIYRVIEFFINYRSRLSKIATGDQALFFRRDFFWKLGGFTEIPLMEDIAISKTAKSHGQYIALKQTVITSARRWEKHGPIKTILFMWKLRLLYFLGAKPEHLAKQYYG